jgi:hypothetical protein
MQLMDNSPYQFVRHHEAKDLKKLIQPIFCISSSS